MVFVENTGGDLEIHEYGKMPKSKSLNLRWFDQQRGPNCGVAASACVANYYNKNIGFKDVHKIYKTLKFDDGMWPCECGVLLNHVGFRKVTIVSCDLDCVDWSWNQFSKTKIIKHLQSFVPTISGEHRHQCKSVLDFLHHKGYHNRISVDNRFRHRIRSFLDTVGPLLTAFNWNVLFKYPQPTKYNKPKLGEYNHHMVAISGYNTKGVRVVDSNIGYFKGNLKKYQTGKYTIPWDDFFISVGYFGYIILPENFQA